MDAVAIPRHARPAPVPVASLAAGDRVWVAADLFAYEAVVQEAKVFGCLAAVTVRRVKSHTGPAEEVVVASRCYADELSACEEVVSVMTGMLQSGKNRIAYLKELERRRGGKPQPEGAAA